MAIRDILADYSFNPNADLKGQQSEIDGTIVSVKVLQETYDVKFNVGISNKDSVMFGPEEDGQVFPLAFTSTEVKKIIKASKSLEEVLEKTELVEFLAEPTDRKYTLLLRKKGGTGFKSLFG